MTIAEALAGCGIELGEARMLLARSSGLSPVALAAHPESELAVSAARAFSDAVARRRKGEPVAYILGEREFYSLVLNVTPDVLIPRPETELLVDFSIEHLPRGGTLADLGTGSGSIALAVKRERPDARVSAVDRSDSALAVARGNASRHRLEIELLPGNWFEPLAGRRFDVIVSNPPYIAEGDRHLGQGDLRFEPRDALAGGDDGLAEIRRIVSAAPGHLGKGGWLAIEHGQGQDAEVRKLLSEAGLDSVSSRADLAGIARISVGKYNLE